MSEDYSRNPCNSKIVEQMVLRDIRDLLQSMGKDIKNYDLPELNDTGNNLSQHCVLILQIEKVYCCLIFLIKQLNFPMT